MTSRLTPIKQFPMQVLSSRGIAPRVIGGALLFLACYYLGFGIRYGFSLPKEAISSYWITAPIIVLLKLSFIGLLRWQASAVTRLRHLDAEIAGVCLAPMLFIVISHVILPQSQIAIPKSVILIDWCLSLGVICSSRMLWVNNSTEAVDSPNWMPLVSYSMGLLLLSIGWLYASLGYQPNLNEKWVDGDVLFPAHVVEDVVVDGHSFSGWMFPAAPFVFPDLVFALVCRAVTDQPAVEMFLTGSLLFLLTWVSAYSAIALATRHRRTAFLLTTFGAVGIAVALAVCTTGTHLKYLFFPAYHTGTYAFAILLAAGGVFLATTQKNRWLHITAFSVLGFCAGFGDLLTVAYVSAPLTVALGVGWLLNCVSVRRAALVSALVWLTPFFGVLCARSVLRMDDFNRVSQRSSASVVKGAARMVLGVLSELQQLSPLFLCAVAWLVACGVWFSVCIYRISRSKSDSRDLPLVLKRRLILLVAFALSGLSTVAALVFGGNYELIEVSYERTIHYLHPLIFTPLLLWPLLIPESIYDRMGRAFPKPVLVQLGIIALIIPIGAMLSLGKGPYRLHRYVPEYVSHLDQIAMERGLTQGIAFYWTARDVNMYSRNHLRVFSVDPELRYYDWINNQTWVIGPFDEGHAPPRPEFVIVSPRECYSREKAVACFGEPVEEIPLNNPGMGYTALIYHDNEQLARQLVLPSVEWSEGFYAPEGSGEEKWRWCRSQGVLRFNNTSRETQPVRIEFECMIGSTPTGSLVMESSFFRTRMEMENHKKQVSEILRIPPGKHLLYLSSDAAPLAIPGDDRTLVFLMRNFKVSTIQETEL